VAIELYHTHHSTCSQKVRITLAEKGLPEKDKDWIAHEVDLGKFEHLDPEYLKMNPNGVVPTLVHGDAVLIESSAIVEYLDEVIAENPLTPQDPVERAKMRAWMRYIEEVPTVAVRVPSFANLLAPMRYTEYSDDQFATHADRLPLRKRFYQRMTQKGFGEADINYAKEQIRQTCERIDRAVSEDGGPFIMGARFTLADSLVAPLIDRMDDLGYDYLWTDDLPGMNAWFDAVRARPSFPATFYPGAKISERYPEHFRTARDLEAERGY
jgi:glutathione S-transferase